MNSIEICTHCYSGSKVPIYHKLLELQLRSLLEGMDTYKDLKVIVSICYSEDDFCTKRVIDKFIEKCENVQIRRMPLLEKNLFRRAIGRNFVAKATKADVVWFCDVDYLFGLGALNFANITCLTSDKNMVFPKVININRTHDIGDRLIQNQLSLEDILHPNNFMERRERKAIGGIQIVRGSWARRNGYLDKTRWINSVDPSEGFRSCRCDVPFRKQVGPSEAVDIPNVYRIRHTRAGRDKGLVDHGEKTRI